MQTAFAKKRTLFLAFKFCVEFGFSCGFFSATSLFINRVGPYSLFYIYLGSSLLALTLSFVFSRVIDRYSRRAVFFTSFLTLGVLVLASWLLIQRFENNPSIYFGIRIFAYSIMVITSLEFGALTTVAFTHSEAKRIFSQLAIVSVLGDMAGGVFIGLTSKFLHTENFLFVWGMILSLSPFLFWKMPFPRSETPGFSTAVIWGEIEEPGTGKRSRAYFKNPVTVMLLVFWLAYSFFCYGTDYVFNSFAAARITDEDSLTALFGRVSALASVGVLAYHLFIAPRLLHRLGAVQNLFVIALLLLMPWVIFSAHPSLITIAIAQGTVYFFTEYYASGIFSTILTLFPERVRGRIRALTEGFGRPLGTVLLFCVAAIFAFQLSVTQMSMIMLIGAAAFFLFPFLFRKPYLHHILKCLHSRDQSLVLNSIQALGESNDRAAVRPLAEFLHESKSEDLQRTAVLSLEHLDNSEAFKEILPILSDPSHPLHFCALEGLIYCRDYQGIYTLLGLIHKSREADPVSRKRAMAILKQVLGKTFVPALLTALNEGNADLQKEALLGLAPFKERRLISVYLSFLNHEDPKISAAAAVALYPFSKSRENIRERALQRIDQLYDSNSKAEQLEAIDAIGMMKLHNYDGFLRQWIDAEDLEYVKHASIALGHLKEPNFPRGLLRVLLGDDEALAIAAGKQILELPKWSRKFLNDKIHELRDIQKKRIGIRLRKTGLDFSEEITPHYETDAMLIGVHHG